jgi:hypothetical protein
MFNDLISVLGMHINSKEFKAVMKKYFPAFDRFNDNNEYQDIKTKVTLRIDSLSTYDHSAAIPDDPEEYKYFIAFFFGEDESEIPFGLSATDDELTVLKKAGSPTFHNKVLEGLLFHRVNDMHYHFENYKMVVSFDPSSGKNFGHIGINLRLKGMKF